MGLRDTVQERHLNKSSPFVQRELRLGFRQDVQGVNCQGNLRGTHLDVLSAVARHVLRANLEAGHPMVPRHVHHRVPLSQLRPC